MNYKRGDSRLSPLRWLTNLLSGKFVRDKKAFAAALEDPRVRELCIDEIRDRRLVWKNSIDGAELTAIIGDYYIPMEWYERTNEYVVVGKPELRYEIKS